MRLSINISRTAPLNIWSGPRIWAIIGERALKLKEQWPTAREFHASAKSYARGNRDGNKGVGVEQRDVKGAVKSRAIFAG